MDSARRKLFRKAFVAFLGQLRIVPDTVIIVLGVVPLLIFLFKTYPHLKQFGPTREIEPEPAGTTKSR